MWTGRNIPYKRQKRCKLLRRDTLFDSRTCDMCRCQAHSIEAAGAAHWELPWNSTRICEWSATFPEPGKTKSYCLSPASVSDLDGHDERAISNIQSSAASSLDGSRFNAQNNVSSS